MFLLLPIKQKSMIQLFKLIKTILHDYCKMLIFCSLISTFSIFTFFTSTFSIIVASVDQFLYAAAS